MQITAQNCEDALPEICPVTGVPCTGNALSELIQEVCRKTCNLCNTPPAASDKTILFLQLTGLIKQMSDQQKITIGPCPTSAPINNANPVPVVNTNCKDKVGTNGVSECTKNANLCAQSEYRLFMAEQCPATCGYCNGTGK